MRKNCLFFLISTVFISLLISKIYTNPVFAQTCDLNIGGVCYYNGMSCSVGGCSNPYDAIHCQPPFNQFDSCVSAYSGDGSQSFCCYNSPPPQTFQCKDQGGLQFSCFTGSCPTNWVSATQNPNTTCAASGQTCCWYNPPTPPPPPPAPGCVSDGSCSAPTPVCGQTTQGTDNCGNPCSRTGPACAAPPPAPACGASCTYSQQDPDGVIRCHSGNCTDGSQNCSFNNNCSFISGCSSGSVVACPAGPPPPPPDLITFKGISANGSTSCYLAEYTASLSWTGTALPSSDSSCPNGYWVDIVQGTSFSAGGFYHKCVQNSTSTSAPAGFGGFNGATGNLIFQKGQTYSARVYNGSHSNPLSLAVPGNACHS